MNIPANSTPEGLAVFTGLMSVLFTNCGIYKDERSERLQLYWSVLGKYPMDEIMTSISDWVQNSSQTPTINDLLKRMPSYLTEDFIVAESWQRIIRAAQNESRSAYHPEFGSMPQMSSILSAERELLSVIGGVERLMLCLHDAGQAENMRRAYSSAYLNSSQKIAIRAEIERIHFDSQTTTPTIETRKMLAERLHREIPKDLELKCPNCGSFVVRSSFVDDESLDCTCKRCEQKFQVCLKCP